uniref:Peptidyl-prolyl cis-trans isomerase, cyclophilin type n=1 Tax=Karlodinium veneficum TaxID=407301 RepID=A7YXX2_KARVE|nr:peptidyl-prolyl cis-trans isomerase, cyclophilin type [Karlodinium veneficum]
MFIWVLLHMRIWDTASTNVDCHTTAGDFSISLDRDLSPLGVDRFLELVSDKFFDDQIIYRVIPGFLMQFGVAAVPRQHAKWDRQRFEDEPRKQSFKHGTVSFAGGGRDSRSCHLFIAFSPNGLQLGNAPHETPIGEVTSGIEVLDKIQSNYKAAGYADLTFLQNRIAAKGNSFVEGEYPKLDRFKWCRLAEGEL